MKNNNHLTPIEEKTLETISKSIEKLRESISSHVTPLTPKERQKLPKMGDKTLAFVKKCYEFSRMNPDLCPKHIDLDVFERDYMDAQGLYATINMVKQLQENLVDTQMCAGSEAYQAALVFYNYVKLHAATNVSGAKAVYEELRKRFPRGRRRKLEEDTPPQADEVVI
ncbi:MAG: hypothetical protein LBI14_08585 [Treponema sp.]|jgi:hypothetical protein|nr:hypothetical protein [Treponema sp.]